MIRHVGTNDNVVAGNFIGTDLTGTLAIGNGSHGVRVQLGAQSNPIGTDGDGVGDAAERNLISANAQHGVNLIDVGTDHNVVAGNFVGTDVTGTAPLGNGEHGVEIYDGAGPNQFGGSAALGNVIAFNTLAGVAGVDADCTGNRIQANAIHSNGALGIDLGADGPTPNDPFDADTGPNDLQNFPVIYAAEAGGTTHVVGTLHSTPNSDFTLDFYANTTADPSGYGEGQRWLGSVDVTTDGAGDHHFDLFLPGASASGEAVTATATDLAGNTSEFSIAVQVAPVIDYFGNSSPLCGGAREGELVTISATFTYLNPLDTHTAVVDWRDGTPPESVAVNESNGSGTVYGEHVYQCGGVYPIGLTVTDNHGRFDQATSTAFITGAGVNNGVLQVVGTAGDDGVTVDKPWGSTGYVVTAELPSGCPYAKEFDPAGIERIEVILGCGNDRATIASRVGLPTVLDGGAGNDRLTGGAGNDLLLGGEGDDVLWCRKGWGANVLIGGLGSDQLSGGNDEDLLIGGTTDHDANDEALLAILAEWSSPSPIQDRIWNLQNGGGLNGPFLLVQDQTVFDDQATDVVLGGLASDWFLVYGDDDVRDRGPSDY